MQPGYQVANPPSLYVQLRCPKVNREWIEYKLALPVQFLGACTLKEGTFVTLLTLQVVAVMFIIYISLLLTIWYDDMNYFWEQKFKADFDPYIENEYKDRIQFLWPLWDDIALILVILHAVYFVTGFGVAYGLYNKNANPAWYLPWLLLTGFLVFSNFGTALAMLIYIFVVGTFRPVTVTWDWVPMVLTLVYAVVWFYGFATVISHYKRRRIVKYWKESQEKLGY